jgi:hypothetical protein
VKRNLKSKVISTNITNKFLTWYNSIPYIKVNNMNVQQFSEVTDKICAVMNWKIEKQEIASYTINKNFDDRIISFHITDNNGKEYDWKIKSASIISKGE